eukprot:2444132-Lingulodinium_polyedra.AAC.1
MEQSNPREDAHFDDPGKGAFAPMEAGVLFAKVMALKEGAPEGESGREASQRRAWACPAEEAPQMWARQENL